MKIICLSLLTASLLAHPVLAQHHTGRGAVIGGATGALAGAAIGEHNGETAEGALIGAGVGLLAGALLGNSMDQEEARARAYAQHQQAYRMSKAVSMADVVNMTRSGIGDSVMINHIRQNGVLRRIEVADVIALHQQGVSEPVIAEMQRARLAAAYPVPAPVVRYERPVVVERHHYVAPVPCYRPPHIHYRHYPHHHHRHARSGVSWSFSFGR
jgi:hypothetical protein